MLSWTKRPIVVVLALAFLVALSLSLGAHYLDSEKNSKKVVNAVLDLSDWDPDANPSFTIQGDLEFYWQEFKVTEPKSDSSPFLIKYPGPWTANGKFSSHGIGSYRLFIKENPGQQVSIWFSWPSTASRMFINKALVTSAGRVGKDIASHEAGFMKPKIIALPVSDALSEIIIEVSNFDLFLGGPLQASMMGTAEGLTTSFGSTMTQRSMMLGAFLTLSIYLLVLFSLRPKDRSPLYLAIMSLFIAIQMSFPLVAMLGFSSFRIGMQQFNIGWFTSSLFFLFFLRSVYPQETSAWFNRCIACVTLFFVLWVLIKPVREYFSVTRFYQFVNLISVIYCSWVLVLATMRKREGSFIFLTAAGVLFLALFHDILVSGLLISYLRISITPQSFLVLIFAQSYLVSSRAARAFATAEHLGQNLTNEVQRQTHELRLKSEELEQQSRKLEIAHADLKDADAAKTTFFNQVSHELRTPLTMILGS